MIVYGIVLAWVSLVTYKWAKGTRNNWRYPSSADEMFQSVLVGGLAAAFAIFMTCMISSTTGTVEKYNAELIPQVTNDNAYMSVDDGGDYEFMYRDSNGDVVDTWDFDEETPVIEHDGTPYVEVSERESPDWAVPFDWMKWSDTSYVLHLNAEAVD